MKLTKQLNEANSRLVQHFIQHNNLHQIMNCTIPQTPTPKQEVHQRLMLHKRIYDYNEFTRNFKKSSYFHEKLKRISDDCCVSPNALAEEIQKELKLLLSCGPHRGGGK